MMARTHTATNGVDFTITQHSITIR